MSTKKDIKEWKKWKEENAPKVPPHDTIDSLVHDFGGSGTTLRSRLVLFLEREKLESLKDVEEAIKEVETEWFEPQTNTKKSLTVFFLKPNPFDCVRECLESMKEKI